MKITTTTKNVFLCIVNNLIVKVLNCEYTIMKTESRSVLLAVLVFFLLPVWKQDEMIISKEYALLGAKALILLDRAALLIHSY